MVPSYGSLQPAARLTGAVYTMDVFRNCYVLVDLISRTALVAVACPKTESPSAITL